MSLLRLGLLAFCTSTAFAQPLPPLPALATQGPASVSGVSSGAYMAVQLHLTQGDRFAGGLASIAGGPLGCAEGSMFKALGPCLGRSSIDVPALVASTQAMASKGEIALPTQGRVFLFSGAKDTVVAASTTQALQAQLEALRPAVSITLQAAVPAAHGWVVEQGEGACDRMAAPHLLPCGHDLAGELLQALHGPLQARAEQPAGRLLRFDQRAFHAGADLGDAGFAYIPAACEAGGCKVHVALHGCRMNEAAVGDAFAARSGLNAWAATNRLVVLYPQTGAGAVNACWDWWGYTGPGYLRADAPQMKAIAAMLERLAQPR
jgi:poly(3-hydroxybutyrate) depolymerase